MITFITVIYVFVCIFLILVVLLQAGRGGGMGAAFGGSSQTVFGGAGAGNFLQRLTVASASLFMILSATLAYLSSSGEQSLERAAERVRVREEARQLSGADAADATSDGDESGNVSSVTEDPDDDAAPGIEGEAAAPAADSEAEGEEAAATDGPATGDQAADEGSSPDTPGTP